MPDVKHSRYYQHAGRVFNPNSTLNCYRSSFQKWFIHQTGRGGISHSVTDPVTPSSSIPDWFMTKRGLVDKMLIMISECFIPLQLGIVFVSLKTSQQYQSKAFLQMVICKMPEKMLAVEKFLNLKVPFKLSGVYLN